MFRSLTAVLVAGTLALSPLGATGAQAQTGTRQAQGDALAGILVGTVALITLGKILQNDGGRVQVTRPDTVRRAPPAWVPPRHRYGQGRGMQPRFGHGGHRYGHRHGHHHGPHHGHQHGQQRR